MEPIQPLRRIVDGPLQREALPSPETYVLPMHPAHASGTQKHATELLARAASAGTKLDAILSSHNPVVPLAVSVKILKEIVGK